MTTRRLFLVLLVLLTLWATGLLSGCATPDVMCDMKIDYPNASPILGSGERTIRWHFGAELKPRTYGMTYCEGPLCRVEMKGNPPGFDDVCGLARLGHEVAHAMGAAH